MMLQDIFLKMTSYCAYQERCEKEVREKLSDYQLSQDEEDAILDLLKEENFLNESRFARSYVRGKFNYKKWGKLKIRQGLKQKGIAENLIQIAFHQIEEDTYEETLTLLLEKKLRTLSKYLKTFQKKQKLVNYAASKGYEFSIIINITDKLLNIR